MSRPDAVMVPESIKRGATRLDRIDSVLAVVEPILEVKRPNERAYIRKQDEGVLFITRDPADTLYHIKGSERDGQPRYAWEDANIPGITGVLIGRLADNPAEPIIDHEELKS